MNTQRNFRRNAILYGCAALLLAAVSVVLRCVNLKFFFDAEIGYYASGAVLPVVANGIMAASVILFAVASLLLFRKSAPAPWALPSVLLRVASGIAAVGFLFLAAVNIINGAAWGGILALGAGLFFAMNISRKSVPPIFRVLTAVCVILRLLFILGESYFDVTVQMNAPDKLLLHLACLAGMLLAVGEVRAAVVKPRPALLAFSLACGVLFLSVYTLPYLLDCFLGVLDAWESFSLLPEALALLALLVFAAARLFEPLREPMTDTPARAVEAVEEVTEAMEEATEVTEAAENATEETEGEPAEESAKNDESEELGDVEETQEPEKSEEIEKSEEPQCADESEQNGEQEP